MRRIGAVVLLVLVFLTTEACYTPFPHTEAGTYETEILPKRDKHSRQGVFKQIALYLPNRIVDAFDIVKLGLIGVGIPLGFDIRITRWGQLALQAGFGAGLVWDGRDHPPYTANAQVTTAFGPWRTGAGIGQVMHIGDFEIGWAGPAGKITVDVAEALDFVVGWFYLDLLEDDYGWSY